MNRTFSWLMALSLLCMPCINAQAATRKHSEKSNSVSLEKPIQKSALAIFLTNYMPGYSLKKTNFFDKTLITHDGTVWKLNREAMNIAFMWDSNTTIVISPGNWCFSNDYLLTNTKNLQTVRASLSEGPLLTSAIYISQIDHFNKTVTLTDGSLWQIYDAQNLDSWSVGEAVLLGVNAGRNGIFNLLVNVNKSDYLAANRFA